MKKILVVEDDLLSARVVRDFLGAHGYAISIATTGVEGLERFEREEPDLMIVDVALPKKNGLELCFDVKRTERGRRMPVLVTSAVYRDPTDDHKYLRDDLHVQGWLPKPFDLAALLERVEQLIGSA